MTLLERFCWECYNFEDRVNIEGTVLCSKDHRPGVGCDDFLPRYDNPPRLELHTQSCSECLNFEDRRYCDENVICAKNHNPGINCRDFLEKCSYECARAAQRFCGYCSICGANTRNILLTLHK